MINDVRITCLSADQTLAVLEIEPKFDTSLPEDVVVSGTIRGPYSQRSHTLPAEFTLSPSSGRKLAARIVDPCYDSDDLPMEYVIEVSVQQGELNIAKHQSNVQLRASV